MDQSWLSEERGQVGSCPSLSSWGWERHRDFVFLPTWSPAKLPGLWEHLEHLITIVLGV